MRGSRWRSIPRDLLPARRGNRFFQAIGRVANGAHARTGTRRSEDSRRAPARGVSGRRNRAELRPDAAARAHRGRLACGAARAHRRGVVRAAHRVRERGEPSLAPRMPAIGRARHQARARRVAAQVRSRAVCHEPGLGAAGGALGVALAELAVRVIVTMGPGTLPLLDDVAVDWRVLASRIGATLVTVVAFGLVPALAASRTDPVAELTSGAVPSVPAGRARRCGGVRRDGTRALARAAGRRGVARPQLPRLMSVDTGFDPRASSNSMCCSPTRSRRPAARRRGFVSAHARVRRAVPEGTAIHAGNEIRGRGARRAVHGRRAEPDVGSHRGGPPEMVDRPNLTMWKSVTPGYFETLGAHARARQAPHRS